MLASDRSASAPARRCQTQHPQMQTWTAMGVRAHPHVAATDSSPPDPSVDSDGSANAPTRRCRGLITPIPSVDSDGSASAPTRRCQTQQHPRCKRGQRRECERTHTSLPRTHYPQIQVWTATGARAHPHVAARLNNTPRCKRGQRRECKRTHTLLPQTRHRQINMDSDGSASAPTRRCHYR